MDYHEEVALRTVFSVCISIQQYINFYFTPVLHIIYIRRQAVDYHEELGLREREILEEVEEEKEWYVAVLPEREAAYQRQLAEWRALRKRKVRESACVCGDRTYIGIANPLRVQSMSILSSMVSKNGFHCIAS